MTALDRLANAHTAQPQESKCPHCGGHLGWVYTIPSTGIVVASGQPIPIGVTAAHTPQMAAPFIETQHEADAREARRLTGCE